MRPRGVACLRSPCTALLPAADERSPPRPGPPGGSSGAAAAARGATDPRRPSNHSGRAANQEPLERFTARASERRPHDGGGRPRNGRTRARRGAGFPYNPLSRRARADAARRQRCACARACAGRRATASRRVAACKWAAGGAARLGHQHGVRGRVADASGALESAWRAAARLQWRPLTRHKVAPDAATKLGIPAQWELGEPVSVPSSIGALFRSSAALPFGRLDHDRGCNDQRWEIYPACEWVLV